MSLADEYRPGRWNPEDIAPEQTELATELRVPFVTTDYPRWNYVGAVVVAPETWGSPWSGLTPTEHEVRMIASFIDEYRQHWYNPWFIGKMAELAPYDIDGSANFAYLQKRPSDGGWAYRKRTWQYGPQWVPDHKRPPATLLGVMDRVHTMVDEVSPRWVEWKAQHPELFVAEVPT